MKVDKNKLMEMLNVTKDSLKHIEDRNQLTDKLKDKGYSLINKIKEGRKVFYIIEPMENQELIELYDNLCKEVYNTNNKMSFGYYYICRTDPDKYGISSKKDLAIESNVTPNTITKWDNKLLELKQIQKDGYYYFCIDSIKNKIYQCSKEEYNNFWRNSGLLKAFKVLQNRYNNGEITLQELQLASADVGALCQALQNKYYYRIKKYKIDKDNKMLIDTRELIKLLFNIE